MDILGTKEKIDEWKTTRKIYIKSSDITISIQKECKFMTSEMILIYNKI